MPTAILALALLILGGSANQAPAGVSPLDLDLAQLGGPPTQMANALWVENPVELQFSGKREVTVADLRGPGVLRMIHFAMPGTLRLDRELLLRIYWDDEAFPSVEAPLVDFFGSPNGEINVLDTAVMNVNRGFNCYLPMAFRRRARIVVSNDYPRVGPEGLWGRSPCYFYALWHPVDSLPDNTGYLHAFWRKEALLVGGRPYLVFRARGQGRFVGWNVSVRMPYPNRYLLPVDLNENLYLDDGREPDLVFQGMEDSMGFSYGFPPQPSQFPYTGWHPIEGGYCAYRWFLRDAVSFDRFCRMTVAFGPREPWFTEQFSAPESVLEFTSVAYWYQREPHEPFTVMPEYARRFPLPSYQERQKRAQRDAELAKRGILMDVKCGLEDEGELAEGFDWRLAQGYTFHDPSLWPGEVNYCWASWEDLRAQLLCPAGTEAKLRLFIADPDVFGGGRRERVLVEARELGVFGDFAKGRWIETQIRATDTHDGRIELLIENAREGSNVVVSRVQLLLPDADSAAGETASREGGTAVAWR